MVETVAFPPARPIGPLDQRASHARARPAVRMALVPPGVRLSFRARDEAAIARAAEGFGVALPREACRFSSGGGRAALWLGPDEWMLLASGDPDTLFATLEGALTDLPHSLVDVSHRSVAFTVEGPEAAAVLNAGCPLDLSLQAFPVGMCTRTVLAKSEIVLRRTVETRFVVDAWRSFAAYVWQFLEEARREFL
ncbi:sarcosine oxidase subunit gamma [Faunimonas pinastri]|uniref:Sarcosine oxidase subunit gamma n=1 Tax=Faunimonas pinastri TaxID=1855383 RepID=A0A1H9HXJ3_9HYPH|nr:sarcosine oxidase subunit gamma family protein [Faunimonas pinastri]SEQ66977.1 sarcosine oxidase subunit gamma [Faunimonas pinastri]